MAKRLIDADKLKKSLRSNKGAEILGHSIVRLFYLDELIDEQPTVDAVEVVRCRDCSRISPSVTAIKDSVYCREFRAYMPCDGYCSYGKRRNDGKL